MLPAESRNRCHSAVDPPPGGASSFIETAKVLLAGANLTRQLRGAADPNYMHTSSAIVFQATDTFRLVVC